MNLWWAVALAIFHAVKGENLWEILNFFEGVCLTQLFPIGSLYELLIHNDQ
jgi:hypothetical protein